MPVGSNWLAVDPGESTGYAFAVSTKAGRRYETGTHTDEEFMDFLTRVAPNDGLVLIVEDFVTRPASFFKRQPAPFLIGALDLYARQHRIKMVLQQPSSAKMVSLRTLKKAGWTWGNRHEADAIRHLVYYAVTHDARPGQIIPMP